MTSHVRNPTKLADPSERELSHIPFPRQHPLFGNTLDMLREPLVFNRHCLKTLGEVYRLRIMGQWRVALTDADAVEYVLTDPDRLFSNALGWNTVAEVFPNGLMVRDFDDHRAHRRIMQAAFRKPALDSYLSLMAPMFEELVRSWPTGNPFAFYPAIKDLSLRIGVNSFMGLPVDSNEAARLNRALTDEITAVFTPIRKPLPFTALRRGLKARSRLVERFGQLIEERRNGEGQDFFSRMCRSRDEDGNGWSDDEIVDHFNFLMMAAHDTTASSLTTMVWALSENPDWQERVASEVQDLGDRPFAPEMLDAMPVTACVFKEALRIMPPVQVIPRKALRAFEWKGTKIPAGALVSAQVALVMRSDRYFTDPDEFDPDRFSENRAEDRSHRFAWMPFSGGAHKCIGMHFAEMQIKAFIHALLRRYRVVASGDRPVSWQRLPISKPRGGLPILLEPRPQN